MNELFELFCKEQKYLKGVSEKTLTWYKYSYRAFKEAEISKASLKAFVIKLQESSLSAVSVNNYSRGMNVFLGWLYENEHIKEKLAVKKIKEDKKVLKTFNESHLKTIIMVLPKVKTIFRST